ncbi:chemotaxis protein [Sphaerospermopsis aphanizomenoides BCCUSP55]|uniref:CheR family methyltransferase n=1 Tax=Sphaerospermopsis aphanizomenoides TaxID=459663 RepID=UPI00190319D7|nr:protein-glutamate O-methyltransferase CheR [Sphaerospermopsis aphanizomenoides]MBK1987937.1 chemotaxis protein [Sphaerospermopsis aphanizomenoides BCCUSP55]
MIYSDGEALLRKKIGLDPNSIGSDAIARAIEQRMLESRITDINSYLAKIQAYPQELDALINSVIIPETWFFRERESFKYLQQYIASEWLPNQKNTVLRVLSVPCSTGEEPYSLAIALLEAGLNPNDFHIDAIDISKKALLNAQRAIYNQYSFRGNPLSFQERYFQHQETGYHLHEKIKSLVNFNYGNLAEPDFLLGMQPYHIVFCRNLLIYFDITTKERTIRILERLLNPEGLLFVGHAEAGLLLHSRFVPIRHSSAFAYRKLAVVHAPIKSKEHKKTYPNYRLIHSKQHIIDHKLKPTPLNLTPKDNTAKLLETAKALADQGHLPEAIELCNDYIKQNKVCVEAYVLLGQLQQAMGKNEDSLQSFQKAIYLQPTHQEALTHLALLKENQGDVVSANILWQRIQRLQNRV